MHGETREAQSLLATSAGRTPDASGDEISRCRDRLAELEAASRALSTVLERAQASETRSAARALRTRVNALAEQIEATPDGSQGMKSDPSPSDDLHVALDALRSDIDGFAASLCDYLEATPQSKLHGFSHSGDPECRRSLEALIDFVLEDDPDLDRRGPILELLVTLLSTSKMKGRRRVVRDPTTLTERLENFSNRVSSESDLDLPAFEKEFIEAARAYEHPAPEETLRRLQHRREELGHAIFAANVLRAVVFFNATTLNAAQVENGVDSTEDPLPPKVAENPPAEIARADIDDPDAGSSRVSQDLAAPANLPDVQWRIDPRPPGPISFVPIEREPLDRGSYWRISVLIASTLILLVSTTQGLWSGLEGTVRVLPTADLQSISSHLDSGYRNGSGSGALFIGTVDPEWARLSPDQREHSANDIITRLRESGLREVLLYDDERRIAVHYATGLPLRVGP